MHESDEEDGKPISNYYGLAPGIAGLLFAGGLCWLMFALADGFA